MSEPYQPQVPARAETVQLRGLRHRLLRWGPPSSDPIVLLHGFQDTAETWQFLIDALPRDWSFAALDWRGFGDSEHQRSSYWFPDYFADLEELLARLAPEQAVRLIGHSMGGNVAAFYMGIRPQRVRWMVTLEGFGLPRLEAQQAPQRYAEWLDELRAGVRPVTRYESVEHFARLLHRRNPRLPAAHAAFVARAWTRPLAGAEPAVELRYDPWHRLVNPVLYRREEAEACWGNADVPALLVIGEHSEFRARLGADGTDAALHRVYRRLTVANVPGVGHMLHHEDPQAVARALLDWPVLSS